MCTVAINLLTCRNMFSLSHATGTESASKLKKALSCGSHQFHSNTFKGTNLPSYPTCILNISVRIGATVVVVHIDTSEEPADNQRQTCRQTKLNKKTQMKMRKLFPGGR